MVLLKFMQVLCTMKINKLSFSILQPYCIIYVTLPDYSTVPLKQVSKIRKKAISKLKYIRVAHRNDLKFAVFQDHASTGCYEIY
jgi:hypothetical protein